MELIKIIENFENDFQIENIDITDDYQLDLIEKLSNEIYSHSNHSNHIQDLESYLVNFQGKYGILAHTAIKIAKSKKLLSEIKVPFHLSIIFSLYRDVKNNGKEDDEYSLIKKITQIKHLVEGITNISWEIIGIDTGCPENTGEKALEILKKNKLENNVKIFINKKALKADKDYSTNYHLHKLASIEYGMNLSLQNEKKNHVVIYTDSNLYIHAGQCGLLVDPIINGEFIATVGSGREPDSIILKGSTRNIQEKLFIYFRKRLLKRLNYITDIRDGFQAYSADFLRKILKSPIENPTAIDVELLLKADLIKRKSVQNVAISRIKPENAPPQIDEYPYLIQLKSFVKMYHSYLSPNAISHKYAYFIKSLTNEDWKILSDNVPEGIQIKPAVHFDIYDEYTVEDFRMILEKNKNKSAS